MSGFIGPKPADVPIGTISTIGTVSGNSVTVGTNNLTVGNTLYVVANGNVGIGTNQPTLVNNTYAGLHIHGNNVGTSVKLTNPNTGVTSANGFEFILCYDATGYI